jgi:hypothetical protein
MTADTPICKNCKHCQRNQYIRNMAICARPLRSKLSLVTGETVQAFTELFCESERREVSKLERLFGCDACGKEGRHFLGNESETRTDVQQS